MKKLLEQKKIKYATFSALMTALFIAVILVINLIIGSFNITFDMTKNKSNSLSEETISYIKSLEEDITIYALYETGDIYKSFEELFAEYEKNSKKIKVQYIDPYQNPQFVDKYKTNGEEIPVGSLIVENSNKFRVVPSTGLIQQGQSVIVNNLEPNLTNAIIYVNDTNTPKIYTITGHNEIKMGASILNALELSNFEVIELNLLESDIPEDTTLLIMTTPQNDYTVNETNKILEYLNTGGSAFITTDLLVGTEKQNYDAIINNFGVKKGNYIAIETETSAFVDNSPINIIGQVADTELTKNLFERKQLVLLPTATGIDTLDTKNQSVTVTPLLTTSDKSYGKTNPNAQTFSYEKDDILGPLALAVLVNDTHSLNTDYITNIVVVGTTAIMDDTVNSYIGGGNSDFIVQSVNYLAGQEDNLYLSPKVTQINTLTLTFQNLIVLLIYSVFIVPLAIMITGAVIFFRRKNR